jgi:hypothetical protein
MQRGCIETYYTTLEIALLRGVVYILRVPNKLSTIGRGKLFQKSGPDDTLRYLRSRLSARDLSRGEALALLGAVHRELAGSEADDSKVYAAYARFIESLQREMPDIHEHVIGAWRQNRHAIRSRPARWDDAPVGENAVIESPSAISRPRIDDSLKQFMRAVQIGVGSEAGSEEPGEPDEAESDGQESEKGRSRGTAEQTEGEEEDEEDEPPQEAEQRTGEEDLDKKSDPEETAEAGELDAEALEAGEDTRTEDAAQETTDAEEGPRSEPDDSAEPDEPESETASAESRESTEAPVSEQTEWPVEEVPESPEPLEEFEGGGAEPPL